MPVVTGMWPSRTRGPRVEPPRAMLIATCILQAAHALPDALEAFFDEWQETFGTTSKRLSRKHGPLKAS